MPTEPTWKHYLTDYNEGLGLVYERFVLNDFLLYLKGQYGFQSVLEAPLFGMAGVERIWGELGAARAVRPGRGLGEAAVPGQKLRVRLELGRAVASEGAGCTAQRTG